MSNSTFMQARDFLQARLGDYQAAYDGFRWPVLDNFNWAIDYFDETAKNNDAPALHIVDEAGTTIVRSYRQMSERSSQVANYLRNLGVRRGDRVLLMIGNDLPM